MSVHTGRKAASEWLAPIRATINRSDYERDTEILNGTLVLAMLLGAFLLTMAVIAFDAA